MLSAAEVIKRGAGSGDADGYLKKVREGAGKKGGASSIDDIIEERRLEFVGEGKRYWDLIRTGKATTTLVADSYNYRTNSWKENKKWLPIPQNEINASYGKLVQNNY